MPHIYIHFNKQKQTGWIWISQFPHNIQTAPIQLWQNQYISVCANFGFLQISYSELTGTCWEGWKETRAAVSVCSELVENFEQAVCNACWIKNKKRFACWIKKVTAFQRRLSVRGQKLGTKIWLKERFKDYLPFQNKFCKFVDVFFIRYIHKNYEMSSNEVGCMLVQKKMKPDEGSCSCNCQTLRQKTVEFNLIKIFCMSVVNNLFIACFKFTLVTFSEINN